MKKIASFEVDHDILTEGLYVSRVDGDVVTYDLRMEKPNAGTYMEYAAIHTFEHLFATYARNSRFEDRIIYVGPMGCRTGFYLLVRNMTKEETLSLVQDSMRFIADYRDEIPGCSPKECGNYLEHSLPGANALGKKMADVLKDWKMK